MKTALLIIDVQNDFCPPHGSLAVPGGDEIISRINKVRKSDKFDAIFLTQDWHPKKHSSFASNNPGKNIFEIADIPSGPQIMWPDHCVQGSKGAEFHPELVVLDTDTVVRKGMNVEIDSYSGFKDNASHSKTELEAKLKDANVGCVYVVGIAYEYCVGFTANDAVDAGFETFFIEDCAAGMKKEDMEAMKLKLKAKNVTFVDSSDLI